MSASPPQDADELQQKCQSSEAAGQRHDAGEHLIQRCQRFGLRGVPLWTCDQEIAGRQEEDRQRSSEVGLNVHMVKPVEPAALERLLSELPNKNDVAGD